MAKKSNLQQEILVLTKSEIFKKAHKLTRALANGLMSYNDLFCIILKQIYASLRVL